MTSKYIPWDKFGNELKNMTFPGLIIFIELMTSDRQLKASRDSWMRLCKGVEWRRGVAAHGSGH